MRLLTVLIAGELADGILPRPALAANVVVDGVAYACDWDGLAGGEHWRNGQYAEPRRGRCTAIGASEDG